LNDPVFKCQNALKYLKLVSMPATVARPTQYPCMTAGNGTLRLLDNLLTPWTVQFAY